jgi:transcriptional repressor NrdR
MHCPFCSNQETQVKDSRPADDGSSIRRRRACAECGARFTTFERIQLREMTVVKADGRPDPFDRDKLLRSMKIALRKRPVSEEQIEKAVSSIVRQLETMGDAEIRSAQIGELVMYALARMDKVAYIRYASVYRDFCTPADFNLLLEELEEFQHDGEREAAE